MGRSVGLVEVRAGAWPQLEIAVCGAVQEALGTGTVRCVSVRAVDIVVLGLTVDATVCQYVPESAEST